MELLDLPIRIEQAEMNRTVAVGLGLGHIIDKTAGLLSVSLGQNRIELQHDIFFFGIPPGQSVHFIAVERSTDIMLERDVEEIRVLLLHLPPADIPADAAQSLSDNTGHFAHKSLHRALRTNFIFVQQVGYKIVLFGIEERKGQVLQLGFDGVQTQTTRQRSKEKLRFRSDFPLFLRFHRIRLLLAF